MIEAQTIDVSNRVILSVTNRRERDTYPRENSFASDALHCDRNIFRESNFPRVHPNARAMPLLLLMLFAPRASERRARAKPATFPRGTSPLPLSCSFRHGLTTTDREEEREMKPSSGKYDKCTSCTRCLIFTCTEFLRQSLTRVTAQRLG